MIRDIVGCVLDFLKIGFRSYLILLFWYLICFRDVKEMNKRMNE